MVRRNAESIPIKDDLALRRRDAEGLLGDLRVSASGREIILRTKSGRRRRAFTFVELLIGLSISAIVLTALAAASYAVAQTWESDDGTQQLPIQATQVVARVRHYLSAAKYAGLVQPGSLTGSATGGYVFYWANDNWGGTSDSVPQIGEMALIQHDPTTGYLWLYQPIPVAQMTPAQITAAGTVITWAEMNDPSWVTTFKGLNYVTAAKLGTSVKGATFVADWFSSTTQRPMIEVTLVLNRPPQNSVTQYAGILLRAPATQPP